MRYLADFAAKGLEDRGVILATSANFDFGKGVTVSGIATFFFVEGVCGVMAANLSLTFITA